MIGSTLGHYRIVAELGRGGMGEVYRADDTRLHRQVAIKVLPEEFTQNPDRLARFKREAQLLASLNHTNIASIHGLEEAEGRQFLVLELAEGETLADRIVQGPIPVEEALPIAMQIAEALETAHEKGIIHRDLKPANIQVDTDGKIKVLDFGLAKALEPEHAARGSDPSLSPTLTSAGTVVGVILGTAAYMSPEQARGKAVDKRADIWGFGCVLYETVTGRQAFGGETVTDMVAAVVNREPDWDALPDALPVAVRRLLRRCLEKDPRNRLRDAGDVRIEIQDAVRGVEELPAGVTGVPVAAGPGWRLLALVAVLAAVAGGLASWRLLHPEAAGPPAPAVRLQLDLEQQLDQSGLPFRSLAISPDGNRVAYVARVGSTTQLYLRELDEFESVPIPGTEGGRSPFFSPDGRSLGFFAQGQLKKISLAGGMPLPLGPVAGFHYGATWGEDDTILLAASVEKFPYVVSAAGGPIRQFEIPDVDAVPGIYRWPHFLPGSQSFLATFGGTVNGLPGPHVVVVSMETREQRVLAQGSDARYIPTGHLIWAQPTGLLAAPFDLQRLELTGPAMALPVSVQVSPYDCAQAAVADNGTLAYVPPTAVSLSTLVWVDRQGRVEPVTSERRSFSAPRISPDGTRVAAAYGAVGAASGDVWIHDLARDSATRLTLEGWNNYPVWTPDGERIMFISNRGGYWGMYAKATDGSGGAEAVQAGDAARLALSFTPDGGTFLFYEVNAATQRDIWVDPADGDPHPLVATEYNERGPMFSPDGKWFAYVSDEGGQDEIYVRRYADSGSRWKISVDGGAEPMWGPDGREIFYRSGDRMMVADVETEPAFRAGRPRELFRGSFARDSFGNPNYDISSDGQRFVMVQGETTGPDQLLIVLNWFEELQRLAP